MKLSDLKFKDLERAVIELEGVEYLISAKTAGQIIAGEKLLVLTRLVDQENKLIPIEWIEDSIFAHGIIDHLD